MPQRLVGAWSPQTALEHEAPRGSLERGLLKLGWPVRVDSTLASPGGCPPTTLEGRLNASTSWVARKLCS
eukprot:5255011-Alexandrium_andersonii.AAC.1